MAPPAAGPAAVRFPAETAAASAADRSILAAAADSEAAGQTATRAVKRPGPKHWQYTVKTGYRTDELKWNIAGPTPNEYLTPTLQGRYVNVLSELSWEDLEIFQLEFGLERRLGRFLRVGGQLAYGAVFNGTVQDSDYAGNNRTLEFSRSVSNSDDGETWDISAALGYDFRFAADRVQVTPLLGLAFNEQRLKMREGLQVVSDYGWPTDLGPIPGLDSSYETEWLGPWLGVEVKAGLGRRPAGLPMHEITFGAQYHYADYHAEADWNLRPDFQHPRSFEHDADGTGYVLAAGYRFTINPTWTVTADGKYQKWETDPGTDRVYFSNGVVLSTVLNEVKWKSWSLTVGVLCRF